LGDWEVTRSDVQHFLDNSESAHPEIMGWSHETREKLAGNLLSIIRDYGLLSGEAKKKMVMPAVPISVARHLERLLLEEGVSSADVPKHPDWHTWLWDAPRVTNTLDGSEAVTS
jgi:hypothetical protein